MRTTISVRVPWHDSRWDGSVCRRPDQNCHCVDYDNILKNKNTEWELAVAGRHFEQLGMLPPCADESGGFLSPRPWRLSHNHPYQDIPQLADTHGHLRETDGQWSPTRHSHPVPVAEPRQRR